MGFLQFSYRYLDDYEVAYGIELANGTWTGKIGHFVRNVSLEKLEYHKFLI